MDELSVLFGVLIFIVVFLLIITVVGHMIWISIAWFIKSIFENRRDNKLSISDRWDRCIKCGEPVRVEYEKCFRCGTPKPSEQTKELKKELESAWRQIHSLHKKSAIDNETYKSMKIALEVERDKLLGKTKPTTHPTVEPTPDIPQKPIETWKEQQTTQTPIEPLPTFKQEEKPVDVIESIKPIIVQEAVSQVPHKWASGESKDEETKPPKRPVNALQTIPPQPSRTWTEVVEAFMEQSNIRWGEIVGGLLIIGCSTALVISLWQTISQNPLFKFLIFTIVTAVIFGIGLYTEHRWKLPTTSRGILTIATLLVPLNFLAIAAVSSGDSFNVPVLLSQVLAPALFFVFVYFAGKVLTPKWVQVLAVGVLGSSVGQILIHHFAFAEMAQGRVLSLGIVTSLSFVGSILWMLFKADVKDKINEETSISIFITLGTIIFAAVLPFGLLLFKSASVADTLMWISPLIALCSAALMFCGALVWKGIEDKELAYSRLAGTSIAIIGALVLVLSMLLAFPNPASIVLTALINFFIFTIIAISFHLPIAHAIALFAFTLAYAVSFHILIGKLAWQLPRYESLLPVLFSTQTGQGFAPLFLLFLVISDLLRRKTKVKDSRSYFIGSLTIALISLVLLSYFGFALRGDFYYLTPIFVLLAAGIFFFAWTRKLAALTWVASFIFILSLTQGYGFWYGAPFAWQTALLIFSSIATIAAIFLWHDEDGKRIFANPFRWSALISTGFVVISLIQSRPWQSTASITTKLFWLSLIWFGLLWMIRSRIIFAATQAALMCACLLTTKLILQNFEWYSFNPYVYLHPTALHIYGSVILLLTVVWFVFRILLKKRLLVDNSSSIVGEKTSENFIQLLHNFFDSQKITFDILAAYFVFIAFVFLTLYSSLHGVALEFSIRNEPTTLPDMAGYSHTFAFGFTAWIVLALLLVSFLALSKERINKVYLYIVVITLSLTCPLIASNFETQNATATAWRWCSAIFLFVSLAFYLKPNTVSRLIGDNKNDETNKFNNKDLFQLSAQLTVVPIIILTIFPLWTIAGGFLIQETSSGFFNTIGYVLTYTLPLVVVAIVFSLRALSRANAVSALASGLTVCFAVVTAHLFSIYSTNGAMDRVVTAQIFQLVAISSSAFSILWLATKHKWDIHNKSSKSNLGFLVSLSAFANLILICLVALRLFVRPTWVGIGTLEAGSIRGWLGFILSVIALTGFLKVFQFRIRAVYLFFTSICFGALCAFTLARFDNHINWRGYHVLFIGMIGTGWFLWLANYLPHYFKQTYENEVETKPQHFQFEDKWNFNTAFFTSLTILFVLAMALRSIYAPATHWWSVAPLMIVCVLALCLFTTTLNRGFVYLSSGLLCIATTIWFANSWQSEFDQGEKTASTIISFFNANITAIVFVGIASFFLEKKWRGSIPEKSLREKIPPFNKFAFGIVFLVLSIIAINGISQELDYRLSFAQNFYLFGVTLFSFGLLAFTSLWDKTSKHSRLIIYLFCLLASLLILDRLNLQPKEIIWIGLVVVGIYALITSLFWWQREKLTLAISNLKIENSINETITWLRPFNFILVVFASLLATVVVFYFEELQIRLLASIIIIVQLFTLGLLAIDKQKQIWQRNALIVFSFGVSLFGCDWLFPRTSGTWMNRSVVLMIVMFLLMAAFGLSKEKLKDSFDDWLESAKRVAPIWIIVSAISLLFVLITEISQQVKYGEVKTGTLALIVVAITLLSGAIACIVFAVDKEKDPLALSDNRRMNYVYIAEGLVALLFMHIRLSMPELFTGFFERYWPIFIVALCYVGIGLSEFLRRQNLTTLSTPIERTGAFLPLLPVLGFWIVNSRVDYSLLLFSIGVLYGVLSLMRRSFGFGILAALAGNGGLWYALHRTDGFGLIQHPQLWFIPFALSVLVAAHLNRDRFSEEQMAGIRYISLMLVYVSSTADIFINGVAESPWLPLVLMLLSVAGVLCGIMFRIRAFLFLGVAFLVISLVTMIYYASSKLEWTWLWWVAGIFVGGAIIFTFALFEKKREEMLKMLENMRAWEK